MKAAIAAVFALIAVAGVTASAQAPATRFQATYNVHARGMQAGEFAYSVAFSSTAYNATASRRMTGVARLALGNSQDYTYSVRGAVDATGLHPAAYQHQGGRRGRIVRVAFSPQDVVTASEPAGMGLGSPPATREQRLGSIDQITMFAAMLTTRGDPCRQSLRIFMDGRARFDLVMSPNGTQRVTAGSFRGNGQRCSVAYRPVAGFSEPQTASTMTFVFARQPNGWQAPVVIEMPSDDSGVIRLEARSFSIS